MIKKLPIAVLISGSGTNLQALIDACEAENYPAEIALVISNNTEAYGLERAKNAGIPTIVIPSKGKTREIFDAELHAALQESGAQLVCLAGFMRLLTAAFTQKWERRMINIHPSLLPAFKGAHAQQDALDYGVKITGCTTHFVTADMDAGPIIMQAAVEIKDGDTLDDLRARTLPEEHRLYVNSVRHVALGLL